MATDQDPMEWRRRANKRIFATFGVVVGVIVLILVVINPGGDDDPSTASPSETASSSEPPANSSAAETAADTPASSATKSTSRKVMRYLRINYTGTSWLHLITRVYEQSGALWADTKIYPDSDADAPGKAICSALSGYQITETDEGFTGVTVRASDGSRLALRTSIDQPC